MYKPFMTGLAANVSYGSLADTKAQIGCVRVQRDMRRAAIDVC